MPTEIYHGVVRDGKVVLDVPLADGTEVNVTPINRTAGSSAAILAALAAAPSVPAEWVDELEQLINNR